MLVYGSVCSGIEAATVAWHPLGWRPAFFAEIDAFPRAVLRHHYPLVPLHGDFTTIQADQYDPIDVLAGGTPCQAFSIAGLRKGLDDDRGQLTLEYLRLAGRLRPRWLVWENVPGVLSLDKGRAFGAFLRGVAELGYGWAYRILDAQYFGLAQRRARVVVVGYRGDWRPAAAVLFERESFSGHPAPDRSTQAASPVGAIGGTSPGGGWRLGPDEAAAGQLIAPPLTSNPYGDHEGREGLLIASTLTGSIGGVSGKDGLPGRLIAGALQANGKAAGSATQQDAENGMLITQAYGGNNCNGPIDIAAALNGHGGPHGRLDFTVETFIAHTLRGEGFDASEDGTGRDIPLIPVGYQTSGNSGAWATGGQIAALTTGTDQFARLVGLTPADRGISVDQACAGMALPQGAGVRRLTPRECERLQGFPDGYTLIPITRTRNTKAGPVAVKRWRRIDADEVAYLADQGAALPRRPDGRWITTAAADGPRYKALGNSWAVPKFRWLGQRIDMVDRILKGLPPNPLYTATEDS